jgi:hypothetical protein
MAQSPALVEDGVHEPVGGAVDLCLGERPELDRLEQEVRYALDLVDHHQPSGVHEAVRAGEAIVSGILVVIWSHGPW